MGVVFGQKRNVTLLKRPAGSNFAWPHVVGIDLSLCKTAMIDIALMESGMCESEILIRTQPEEFADDTDRIRYIRDELMNYLKKLKGEVRVCIEAPAFHARGRAVSQIFGLNAVVRSALRDAGIPFVDVSPSEVKKFATGKGNAEKTLILREVWRRFQFDASDDNSADAYVLAQIGLRLLGRTSDKDAEFQKEIVDNILNRNRARK